MLWTSGEAGDALADGSKSLVQRAALPESTTHRPLATHGTVGSASRNAHIRQPETPNTVGGVPSGYVCKGTPLTGRGAGGDDNRTTMSETTVRSLVQAALAAAPEEYRESIKAIQDETDSVEFRRRVGALRGDTFTNSGPFAKAVEALHAFLTGIPDGDVTIYLSEIGMDTAEAADIEDKARQLVESFARRNR